ncbi:MAG: GPW/gp25 family protein [Roseivirga sp.]|nr:GPW/gp25 family protein [Roseivirga sp.]
MMINQEENDFLGIGWSSPPTFQKGIDTVVMQGGVDNINENLKSLISTNLGERPFKRNFGTHLRSFVFHIPDAEMQNKIKETVRRAITEYEPRIDLEEVEIDMSGSLDGLLIINVSYLVIKVNTRHNFVYPFYINEGSYLNF